MNIRNKIHTIRGHQIILDTDLAELYGVETKSLNQAVKRNIMRFPENFMFQLTKQELRFQNGTSKLRQNIVISNNFLRSQFVTSKTETRGGRRYMPYAFTEQGVAMLSGVLKSDTAIKVSIQIMNAFVSMRRFLTQNSQIFHRLDSLEIKQIEYDRKFDQIFKAIEDKSIKPSKGIFFDGSVFDAYVFVSDLIKSANKSIILIDNYIDETVLTMFSKRKKNVEATILTKYISKQLKLDLHKHNQQFPKIKTEIFKKSHDRFLIIDKDVYHIGASLKDLGKKWFAFSKFDRYAFEIIGELNSRQCTR